MADHSKPLLESEVAADPYTQLDRWIDDAAAVTRVPGVAALATATAAGRPSLRMVLIVSFGPDGLCFHSDVESRKSAELQENPAAALLFNWDGLGRQVRVEGTVERLNADESDAYFASRPREARLVVHASRQSAPVADRATLEAQLHATAARLGGGDIPRPATWGGFRLLPERFEMWQHREDRLHDRLVYVRTPPFPDAAPTNGMDAAPTWALGRLQP